MILARRPRLPKNREHCIINHVKHRFTIRQEQMLHMCYTPKSHLKNTNKTAPYNQSPKSIVGATERRAARDRSCFGTFFWRSGDMQIWSAF
jgi:hypothetical protein